MALCVYKRIRQEPIRLNLNNQMVVVRGGQFVVVDNSQMMGIPGFAFVRIHNQKDHFIPASSNLVITKPNPIIETSAPGSPAFKYNSPGSINVQSIDNQQFTSPSLVSVSLEEVNPIQEVVVETVKPVNKPKTIGFNPETIEKLKNFDNKQWFTLKKEDIIKFLEDANIEYKHISSDKWELLKFLKKVIKELI